MYLCMCVLLVLEAKTKRTSVGFCFHVKPAGMAQIQAQENHFMFFVCFFFFPFEKMYKKKKGNPKMALLTDVTYPSKN